MRTPIFALNVRGNAPAMTNRVVVVRAMRHNGDNMKWLGFGATNLSHATKLTGSKLANKPTNTQLFYIMC